MTKKHVHFFQKAAVEAQKATCRRAKCGSVIVSVDGKIIGCGFNAPPLELESQRFCDTELNIEVKPKYDKTCCIHAEWNAIIDALKNNSDKIKGSTLYFMRIDDNKNFTDSGDPFCTVCSRLALQSGVGYFALWDKKPIIYKCLDYNIKTFEYYR